MKARHYHFLDFLVVGNTNLTIALQNVPRISFLSYEIELEREAAELRMPGLRISRTSIDNYSSQTDTDPMKHSIYNKFDQDAMKRSSYKVIIVMIKKICFINIFIKIFDGNKVLQNLLTQKMPFHVHCFTIYNLKRNYLILFILSIYILVPNTYFPNLYITKKYKQAHK